MANLKVFWALNTHAARIEVLHMDVDGTMTAGGITLLSQTEEVALEIMTFDAHDGQGHTPSHTAGIRKAPRLCLRVDNGQTGSNPLGRITP